MKKVLVLYNRIWPYRVPIFNLLNKKYDLTVSYSLGNDFTDEVDFKVKKLSGKHFSKFFFHDDNLHEYCKNFDVVVAYGDISWLSVMKLLFKRKKEYKIILWGIGVRASYKNSYGSKTPWDMVRFFLMRKADAVLFYSKNPINLYLKQGFKKEKLQVANNTVFVEKIEPGTERNSIIFIGTLYKQKRIYELLNSYFKALQETGSLPILKIIGDGDEFNPIKEWIKNNKLEKQIILLGKIFDEVLLSKHFSSSLACISPGQAGLSVLKSMGYGVPFITKLNAITGGEIFNIENKVSGILYENDNELKDIIVDISENKSKYIKMGEKAKNFYDNHRKPEDMAQGISNAIEYVSQ